MDPATSDINAANFGSAFSSGGSLSSTNLATPSSGNDFTALNDPNYFSSGATDTGTLSTPSYSSAPSAAAATGAPASTPASSSGGVNWGSLGNTAASLAPSLLAGGIGLSQAKGAQKQSDAFAAQLTALGGPYTAAGQALLKQFQAGQIRPDQANVANLATAQGQTLIDSGAGLSAIAQSAYQNYQAGKLPPADEQRLSDQMAAQKQEMRARLAQSGITDSSILAGYDQQIENQANINRQDLLDKRFATGNQAYDEWLKSTTEGQQLKLQGAQFASQALDQMLNESLALGAEGMAPITQAIQLKLQSDAALSAQVSQLMGNLASSYAYSQTGGRAPQGGGTAGAVSSVANLASKSLAGGGGASGASGDSTAVTYNPDTTGAANQIDLSGLDSATSSGTPNFDGSTTAGPSAAGGVAATGTPASTTDWSNLGTAAAVGGGALGVYSGLKQGGGVGTTKAAVGATQIAGKAGLVSPQVNTAAGTLGNALGIYTGLKQGGVGGYGGAAVNATQLASKAGLVSPAVGAAAGYAAAPLALYNEIKTWQSGATGSDALAGAETGAAIGSVVPVIGTAVGAIIGGIAGAISSLFGSGKKGAAAGNWDQLTKSNALKSTPGRDFSQKSWAEAFKGMLDEGNNIFAGGGKDRHKDPDALAKPLETQIKSGMAKLGPNATTDQVYNQVIVPWMQTSGSGLNWSVLKNEPQQQLMIKSAVDRVLAGEPIIRAEMTGPT